MRRIEYFISVPEAERIFGKEPNLSCYEFCGYYRLIQAACGCTFEYPENSLNIKEIDEFLKTMSERRRQCMKLRFWECLTLKEIGKSMNISGEMVRQILQKILYIINKRFSAEVVKSTLQAKEKVALDEKGVEYQCGLPIQKLNLSERCLNILLRAGLDTIGKVLVKSNDELLRVRNFGNAYMLELDKELERCLGLTRCSGCSYDLNKLKTQLQELISKNKQYQFQASIEVLRLSTRTSNVLKRVKIYTLGDLLSKSDEELLKVINLGPVCLNEIDEKLEQCFGIGRRKEDYGEIKQKFVKALAEGKQYEFDGPIEILNLSMRPYKALKRNGINSVGELISKDKKQLLKLREIGFGSVEEIRIKIREILDYECFN